jgi:hypothetical protein
MRKLSKKSKAVLGAATILLFAFAGAQAGALHLQLQRLDSSALRSQGLSAPTAWNRQPATRSNFKFVGNQRLNGIADAAFISLAHAPHLGGVASAEALSAYEPWLCASLFPRAPPLS